MNNPINVKLVSFETLKSEIESYVRSLPDHAKWKDFYASSAGQTIIELLAGMGSYLSYHSAVSRREVYLDSAKLVSSVYNIGATLGYEPNRLTAPTFRIKLKDSITSDEVGFHWVDRFVPVGTYEGKELVLLNEYSYANNLDLRSKVFDICIGSWERMVSIVGETKPFLKMFFENRSIDNSLDHISIWISEASQLGRAYLTPVRYAEQMQPPNSESKVLVRTLADGVVLVFGDGEFGFKPLFGSSVAFDFVSTVGRADVEVSSSKLKENINWAKEAKVLSENIDSIEVLNPGYGGDSIEKIKTLARGYFAARRRMLTADDHKAVLMSYPDVISVGLIKKAGAIDISTTDFCCTVEMCPLFIDEHMVNQDMREIEVLPVDLIDVSGGKTVLYEEVILNSLKESFGTDHLVSLRSYPKRTVPSTLPTNITEWPYSYKIQLLSGEDEGKFILKDAESDEPILSNKTEFNEETFDSQNTRLTLGLKNYLEDDRFQGSRKRLSTVLYWDLDHNRVVTVSDLELFSGMKVTIHTPEKVYPEVHNVCLPDVFHRSALEYGESREWIVERIKANEYGFRYDNGEPVILTKYKDLDPAGRAYLKWDAEARNSPVVGWSTDDDTFTLASGYRLSDGEKVWFRAIDPDSEKYYNEEFHFGHHDPVDSGNPWNKLWARAEINGEFVPLSLFQRCYSEFGYNQQGNGPEFRAYLVDETLRKYKLKDLYGNDVVFTHEGDVAPELHEFPWDNADLTCWICWAGTKKNDLMGSREQRSILEYLDDFKVVGEAIDLVDPIKTVLQVKMTLIIEPYVVIRELEFTIQAKIKNMIYSLGTTFKPGEMVREVSRIEGVKRVYLQWPTKDKTLAYNEYIGFDNSTYLDLLVRQANFGDKNHYISPLDLTITTEEVFVDMEPDYKKGYYSI